jgi:hypothetical protein
MNILIDNKEIENFTNTNESINVLSYKELEEVHDGIYLIKTHNNQTFLKEAKSTWKSKPVVEFNVLTNDRLFKSVKFVLEKRDKTLLNYSSLGISSKRSLMTEQVAKRLDIPTETNANIYEERLKLALDVNIQNGKKIIADTIDRQQEHINKLVAEQVAAKVEQLTTDIINDLVDTRSRIIKDLQEKVREEIIMDILSKKQEILHESIARISKMEDVVTTCKQRVDEAAATDATTIKTIEEYKRAFDKEIRNVRTTVARVAESGGGTNAVQYANGGVMNGTLNINGDLNVANNITGHIGLSSLNQEGAANEQVIMWSDSLARWVPGDATIKRVHHIGDGVASSFTINHQLSSLDLIYQVYDNSTQEVVLPYIKNADDQNTEIAFSFVPTPSAYRVIIIK